MKGLLILLLLAWQSPAPGPAPSAQPALKRIDLTEVQSLRLENARQEAAVFEARLALARIKVRQELARLSAELGVEQGRLAQVGPKSEYVLVQMVQKEQDNEKAGDPDP